MIDPLKVRLFGYGTPYRVSIGAEGAVVAGETDEGKEAENLYHTLRGHVELADKPSSADAAGQWSYSMPFGRCGVDDLPREHLLVYNACEAHLDVLSDQGLATRQLGEGEIAHIEPGTVVRLRALPRQGQLVLVAFQTEDRTPLSGNAGPYTLDGLVPDDWRERLAVCHAAFDETAEQAKKGWHQPQLQRFFAAMAEGLADNPAIAAIQADARAAGSYEVVEERGLFERQRALLDAAALERIKAQDEAVFRFPGMFGAVAPLFNLID